MFGSRAFVFVLAAVVGDCGFDSQVVNLKLELPALQCDYSTDWRCQLVAVVGPKSLLGGARRVGHARYYDQSGGRILESSQVSLILVVRVQSPEIAYLFVTTHFIISFLHHYPGLFSQPDGYFVHILGFRKFESYL